MTLTNRIISRLPDLLSEDGVALIVFEQINKPFQVMEAAKNKYNLNSTVVIERRAGRELLYVIKFSKNNKK